MLSSLHAEQEPAQQNNQHVQLQLPSLAPSTVEYISIAATSAIVYSHPNTGSNNFSAPDFTGIAFFDQSPISAALGIVLRALQKRVLPAEKQVLMAEIERVAKGSTVGALGAMQDKQWQEVELPIICRIYLKQLVSQARLVPFQQHWHPPSAPANIYNHNRNVQISQSMTQNRRMSCTFCLIYVSGSVLAYVFLFRGDRQAVRILFSLKVVCAQRAFSSNAARFQNQTSAMARVFAVDRNAIVMLHMEKFRNPSHEGLVVHFFVTTSKFLARRLSSVSPSLNLRKALENSLLRRLELQCIRRERIWGA